MDKSKKLGIAILSIVFIIVTTGFISAVGWLSVVLLYSLMAAVAFGAYLIAK